MDRRERYEDQIEAMRVAQDGLQARIWTAMPAVVVSYNPEHMTIKAQIAIKGNQRKRDGSIDTPTISECHDVPVHMPSAGGFSLTMPVKAGDECLLVFASRCIDNWWDKGGVQTQAELRMHDLSDAFAILGTRSRARALGRNGTAAVSAETLQLRSDDGKTLIEVDGKATVRIVAPGKVRLETPLLEVTGEIKAKVADAGVTLSQHRHQDVEPGTGDSGPPRGGT